MFKLPQPFRSAIRLGLKLKQQRNQAHNTLNGHIQMQLCPQPNDTLVNTRKELTDPCVCETVVGLWT